MSKVEKSLDFLNWDIYEKSSDSKYAMVIQPNDKYAIVDLTNGNILMQNSELGEVHECFHNVYN